MSAVLTLDLEAAVGVRDEEPPAPWPGGHLTLDDVIVGAWEGVATHHEVACPVCGGVMAPRYGAHATPVGGRCRDCGTTLA